MNDNAPAKLNNFAHGLNECFINVLKEHDLIQEVKSLMDFATSKDWT